MEMKEYVKYPAFSYKTNPLVQKGLSCRINTIQTKNKQTRTPGLTPQTCNQKKNRPQAVLLMPGRRIKNKMPKTSGRKDKQLRQASEQMPGLATPKPDPNISAAMEELVQELRIHQAELEIQNEELRQSQDELAQLYEDYRRLYESAPLGYLTLNRTGCITRLNRTGAALLGRRSPDKALSKGFDTFLSHGWIDSFWSALALTGRTGEKKQIELRLKGDPGSALWVEAYIEADRSDCGRVSQWRIMLMDITGNKKIQRRLSRLNTELSFLERTNTMGQLAGSLAHELNQPLTAILTNAQAGLRFMDQDLFNSDLVRSILDDIVSDGQRAKETIRQLRAFFKKKPLNLKPMDMYAAVREAVLYLKNEISVRDIAVSIQPEEERFFVLGDRVHLLQVVLNCVMNAMQAMTQADISRKLITIGLQKANDKTVTVKIQDTGPGIDKKHLKQIFDPFFTTRPQGMGMGLYTGCSIIEAHGGRLWAENNPQGGAIFSFTLPLAQNNG